MFIVGLTGGIGSGKTSVLQLFINYGISVYIADIEAKKLMNKDAKLIADIMDTFGKKSYKKKKLNSAYIAKKVFSDKKMLQKLNTIVHPAVHRHFLDFKSKQSSPYIVYENAILFENGSNLFCDYIITVTAPIETRIKRVVKRDKTTIAQVKSRMQHQWDDKKKIEKSNFTIQNSNWELTKKVVERLHQDLLVLSKNKKSQLKFQ